MLEALASRWAALTARLEAFPFALIQLAARVGVGGVFLYSGFTKITPSWELTPFAILLFRDEYKVPLIPYEVAAYMATAVELIVPWFLFAGLFSRLATLPLLGMVAVIQVFVYPDAWRDHLLWATALTIILTRGPGPLSLDAVLGNALGYRPAPGHAHHARP